MTKELISIYKICDSYQIPNSFFEELQNFDLIPVYNENDETLIDATALPKVEKILRLHYDLNINLEGVEVIFNLLQQIDDLQNEIDNLKRRLRLYEDL